MSETIRLLTDLVRIPSVNPMGRPLEGPQYLEHGVTAYLENFFRSLGVRCERQPVAPRRENLIARWDQGAPRTILLEAHQDTVPVDGMTIDPFGAVIDDGKLYGRGACDIKAGLAAMLTAFARVVREKPAGAANVVMACTVDEEHTFLGVQRLVEDELHVDEAVVAEPTRLAIINAHKGAVRWYLTTSGRSCHSSTPEQGVNAIYRMARLLVLVEEYAEQLRLSRSDPLLGPPTLSVGRIEGGSSVNTVPDFCRVEVDRRLLPDEDPQAAPSQLATYLRQRVGADFPWECSPPWLACPALAADNSARVVERLGRAVAAVRGSHQITTVPYGTNASTLAAAGIPAVVFGPGDIAQAHTRDEWVDLNEVEQAAEILYRFVCEA